MSAALDFLRSFTDYEQKQPPANSRSAFDLGRMRRFLARLGNPHAGRPCVHITGTKGKGSVTHFTDAVLRAHGLRTFRFLSPHVERLNERVAIDGADVSDGELDDLVEELRPHVEALLRSMPDDVPTFFESMTAIGFLAARRAAVDADVLEVGLGGRLDATNVVDPTVSVVTSIDLDHTKILGTTHDAIAREKAGIIKAGRYVLLGLTPDEPGFGPLAAAARAANAPAHWFGNGFDVLASRLTRGPLGCPGVAFTGRTPTRSYGELFLGGGGVHQARNALLALAAAETVVQTCGRTFTPERATAALEAVRLPARAELFECPGRAAVLLDGAHTARSCAAVADLVGATLSQRPVILLGAHTEDRDPASLFAPLRPMADRAVFTRAPSPRSAEPSAAAGVWNQLGGTADPIPDPRAAFSRALALATPHGLVVVTGSFYLAGAIRALMRGTITDGPDATTPLV